MNIIYLDKKNFKGYSMKLIFWDLIDLRFGEF